MLKADNLTTFMCRFHEIWEPQWPGTLRACLSQYRDSFTFTTSEIACFGILSSVNQASFIHRMSGRIYGPGSTKLYDYGVVQSFVLVREAVPVIMVIPHTHVGFHFTPLQFITLSFPGHGCPFSVSTHA